MSGPLLVLDSASLYYRSYYALPSSMTAPDGRPHNAIRGFLSTVTRLVASYRPSGIVAAWDDDWRPEWRVGLVPSYKAHRVAGSDASGEAGSSVEDEPADLAEQAEAIAALLDLLGADRWGVPGFEADDVIGTVASRTQDTIIVSGDRDLVQLIDSTTQLLLTVNGGMEKWPLLDPEAATARFGVAPDRYVDLAVLRGDPSDGLPGVPGIGPKTAVSLISAFGDVEGVIRAAGQEGTERPMTPRLAPRIADHADALRRARVVTSVVRTLDLPDEATPLNALPSDPAGLKQLAEEWGVSRQVRELVAALGSDGA